MRRIDILSMPILRNSIRARDKYVLRKIVLFLLKEFFCTLFRRDNRIVNVIYCDRKERQCVCRNKFDGDQPGDQLVLIRT